MLAVMTLSAVKGSYFCIEYCTDVYTVIDFFTVNTLEHFWVVPVLLIWPKFKNILRTL